MLRPLLFMGVPSFLLCQMLSIYLVLLFRASRLCFWQVSTLSLLSLPYFLRQMLSFFYVLLFRAFIPSLTDSTLPSSFPCHIFSFLRQVLPCPTRARSRGNRDRRGDARRPAVRQRGAIAPRNDRGRRPQGVHSRRGKSQRGKARQLRRGWFVCASPQSPLAPNGRLKTF